MAGRTTGGPAPMSSKRGASENVEEPVKKPKLDVENSIQFLDTKKIPKEIWQQIFGFFSLKEIKLNIALVCKHFNVIANDCMYSRNYLK